MGLFGFNSSGKAVIGSTLLVPNVSYKDTPVTITSWSYVTTTITLNVASHTFVAGDYIEVSGLTATTNIPNGVHLVTSVTATTIVFTYSLTPTGTAGVSSAIVKGYMTTNGRLEAIGVGKTFNNVTGSRALATTYTNTTGNTIIISIVSYGNTVGAGGLQISINGAVALPFLGSGSSTGATYGAGVIIIPAGATYNITNWIVAQTVASWIEVR